MTTVVVVGGSLTGMAAAARLARVGHRVVLLERRPVLGGRAAGGLPEAIALPAAWRDLFKKSGRTLDADLARNRLALVPAPPAVRTFADGTTLALPTDRGEQWATLTKAYGPRTATRWRDLLDNLDDTWQVLRRLGLEAELPPGGIPRTTRRALTANVTIEDLARRIDHPHLAELVRQVARELGSDPRRTPGWCAARLSVERTFGRWQITDAEANPLPSGRLVGLLADRLDTRGVDVRLGETVLQVSSGRVTSENGRFDTDRVVVAVNPWAHDRLVGHADPVIARAARRLRPAAEPARAPDTTATRAGQGGPQWRGWRTVHQLPRLSSGLPGIVAASSCSPGGPDPWARLLTGALAAYRVHFELTGEDIRPTNRTQQAPRHSPGGPAPGKSAGET